MADGVNEPALAAADAVLPPRLELGEWRLRGLRVEDAAAWLGYLREPAVTEHTSWPAVDAALVEGLVRRSIAGYGERTSCRCAIAQASEDRLIGTCGFSTWSDAHASAELVYDLDPTWWGRGVVRRAAGALVEWGFSAGLCRIQAVVMPSNHRSVRVLESLGFRREGLLGNYRKAHGTPTDFYMYARLALPGAGSPGRGHGQAANG